MKQRAKGRAVISQGSCACVTLAGKSIFGGVQVNIRTRCPESPAQHMRLERNTLVNEPCLLTDAYAASIMEEEHVYWR